MILEIAEMINFINDKNFKDETLNEYYFKILNENNYIINNVTKNEQSFVMLFVFFICTVFQRKKDKTIRFKIVKDFNDKENIERYSELIKLMFICEEHIKKIPNIINEDLYYNVHFNLAQYYFIVKNFIEALDYIKIIETYTFKDQILQDHLVLKALILEELAIYNYITPYKNTYEMTKIINQINENKCIFMKGSLKDLKKDFYNKKTFPLPFSEIQDNHIPDEILKVNRDEELFYINNKQVINPYNRLLIGTACPLEGIDDKILNIKDDEAKVLFNSLLNDFYYVRQLNFRYQQNEDYTPEDFCIVNIFAYSLFDKISWIINKKLDLTLKDNEVYFSSIFNNRNIFGDFEKRNKNLFALYTYQRLLENKKFNGQGVKSFSTLRNDINHKSSSLIYNIDDTFKRIYNNFLIQTISGAIIHLNMLIYYDELDGNEDFKSNHLFIFRSYKYNRNKEYLHLQSLCQKKSLTNDDLIKCDELCASIKKNFIKKIKENYQVQGVDTIKIEGKPEINLFITVNETKINFKCVNAKWEIAETQGILIESKFKEELIDFCNGVNLENFKVF